MALDDADADLIAFGAAAHGDADGRGVVANQIGAYASSVGIPVRCRPEGEQIRVRVIQRHPTRPVERAG